LPRAATAAPLTLGAIAIALNGGRARSTELDTELPAFESLAPPATVAPLRERVQSREGRAELLVFRVGTELFATELRAVEEAVEGADARMIPDAPPTMLGIFALRDRTLPMYSLARVLGLTAAQAGEMTLVMRSSGSRIAVAVDAVDDVFDAPLDGVRTSPTQDVDGMVLGIVWRGSELVTLLDADVVVAACLVDALPNAL
jgi:purine-binding chemotaxis protein CheW